MAVQDLTLKDIVRLFFVQIILILTPSLAKSMRLNDVEWLDKEGHDFSEGRHRLELDMLGRMLDEDGNPCALGMEIQRQDEAMDPRMDVYRHVAALRAACRVVMLLLMLKGRRYPPGAHLRTVEQRVGGVLYDQFRYWCVALPGMDVQRLLRRKEAVAGLLAGYAISGRVENKGLLAARCTHKIWTGSGTDEEGRWMLYTMLRTDLKLTRSQEAERQRLLDEDPRFKESRSHMKNYAAVLREQAVEEARPRIVEEALREAVRDLLEANFGPQPDAASRLDGIHDVAELRAILRRVSSARSMRETGLL